jgi:pilus assembly protein CpaB
MNARTIATLAVAIFLGIVAVAAVRAYLTSPARNHQQAQQGPLGQVAVVVAAKPIERGLVLTPDILRVVRYPADAAPAGAFQDVAQLTGTGQAGRLAIRSMGVNEAVLDSKITGPGGKLTLSTTVLPGMRAVSLRSSDVAGVAGFVLPGDHVDILLTRTIGSGEAAQTVTQALAQNILVLGVDQSNSDEQDKPVVARAVTVMVTPLQAETISLAQAVGQVSFALRHVADEMPLARIAVTPADLGFAPRPAVMRRRVVRRPSGPALPAVSVTRGVETTGYSLAF